MKISFETVLSTIPNNVFQMSLPLEKSSSDIYIYIYIYVCVMGVMKMGNTVPTGSSKLFPLFYLNGFFYSHLCMAPCVPNNAVVLSIGTIYWTCYYDN